MARRTTKTAQIQIRVTAAEKAELVRRARAAGLDLTAWMMSRLAPPLSARFAALCRELATTDRPAYVLAELNELLAALGSAEFESAVEPPPRGRLDEVRANQLAAMVETTAARLGRRPPPWVHEVPPLRIPWFSTDLTSLRLHLLVTSRPCFRRRNLFVDSTIGDRA